MNIQATNPIVSAILTLAGFLATAEAVEFPGPAPGEATGSVDAGQCQLEDTAIGVSWLVVDGRLRPGIIIDRLSAKTTPGGSELFTIALADGRTFPASDMSLLTPPHCEDLPADAEAVRLSSRCVGKCISATMTGDDGALHVQWRAIMRDGDNYVRQELTLRVKDKDLPLAEITLLNLPAETAATVGVVRGSPVVAGNFFFACENPLADNQGKGNRASCRLPWQSTIKPGEAFNCSSVVGVAPAGQMRRAFLHYIERQRPRPYRPFLHYNSWYDIAWVDRKMNEAECLAVIGLFGREFVERRGGRLDSFVFDDGWDDNQTLWGFHAGFPNGFKPLEDAAAKYQSAVGVWLSPWGGYDPQKSERLSYGRTQGFEINNRGFALAGPNYYARFRDTCRQMIEKYGVNFFKFDGVGEGLEYERLSAESLADMAAVVRLCDDLRQARPDVYISLTTGTWPSPFWLLYGDNIWRNGEDAAFCGGGTSRQRWLNFRDATTQQNVVRRGELYPLNSVMNQGITYAQRGIAAEMGRELKDVVDEFRMFFGCGTQLQELYMTPQMMTPEMWDALAETAKWSRDNADVLVDTHWIGGDAGKGEIYGYASWSQRKGILCVRNPSFQPKAITLKLAEAFELPLDAPQRYSLKSPWKTDADTPAQVVEAKADCRMELQPFEVRILDATP